MVPIDRSIPEAPAIARPVVGPIGEGALRPAPIDPRPDRRRRVVRDRREASIGIREPIEQLTVVESVADGRPFLLHPGEFVLRSALERVAPGDEIAAGLERTSPLWRSNLSTLPACRCHGRPIGQRSFQAVTAADRPPA